MRLLFIRHGKAVNREDFEGEDMMRPLTDQGCSRSTKVFAGLARLYPDLQLILSSQAVRAKETAEILADSFKKASIVETELLNPGATHSKVKAALKKHAAEHDPVALVGHEPDFSQIISEITSNGNLRIEVKKSSCVEVEINGKGFGELKALLPPKFLGG